jgi:hypothetical protein
MKSTNFQEMGYIMKGLSVLLIMLILVFFAMEFSMQWWVYLIAGILLLMVIQLLLNTRKYQRAMHQKTEKK